MQKRRAKALTAYVRRATRAVDELIPPTVFIPVAMKRSRKYVVGKKLALALTSDEIAEAITRSQPHEFLIAVMEGRPIPRFVMQGGDDGRIKLHVEYFTADLQERTAAARTLMRKVRSTPVPEATDYEKRVAAAAAQVNEDEEAE